jgi:hypothetical protein
VTTRTVGLWQKGGRDHALLPVPSDLDEHGDWQPATIKMRSLIEKLTSILSMNRRLWLTESRHVKTRHVKLLGPTAAAGAISDSKACLVHITHAPIAALCLDQQPREHAALSKWSLMETGRCLP